MKTRKFIPVLAVVALTLFFTLVVPVDAQRIEQFVKSSGWLAPVVFSLLMLLGILIAPIPTSPLTLMAPKLFGLWGGLLLSLASATVGATIAFFIARGLGHKCLDRYPGYRRLQHLLPPNATAFAVFLLRLPPSPTFDLVSYLAGLTEMSPWQFMLATFLGMIPVTATFCFVGAIVPGAWLWPFLIACGVFGALRLWRRR